jgi:glycosyltransferase involved in cell wall biosynthesis
MPPDGSRPLDAHCLEAADLGLTIVVLNDFCHVQGGASKVAIDEAIALAESGIEVIFLGAAGPVDDRLRRAPLTTICLNQPELLEANRHPSVVLQGLWNLDAARWTRQILAPLSRDRTIVHVHGYTKALTTSPVRVAGNMGFTVLCTLHDFFAACPNGAFFDYVKAAPCPKRALSLGCIATNCDKRHYAHKLFRVARGIIQRSGGGFPAHVHHYVSLSERSAALLGAYLPADAAIHPLENPIEVEPGPPVDVAANEAIVCVGRLDIEKGPRLLAEAARRVKRPVIFVGDGPLAAELKAIPGVSVTGWLPPAAVRGWLGKARCLAFPSLWYETYGLVVAEAAAHGVPAIVSDISAAAERVENGVTGWHFRSGDADDLERCLRLLPDDALVGRIGNSAHARFWANPPTREHHTRALLELYRTILSETR